MWQIVVFGIVVLPILILIIVISALCIKSKKRNKFIKDINNF